MKKLLAVILTLALLVSAGVVGVFALGGNFRDADSNGVCDNAEIRAERCKNTVGNGFVDKDEDGVCDTRLYSQCPNNSDEKGFGNCSGKGFVDEDNDGVCDNRADNTGKACGKGSGVGQSQGKGLGQSQGKGTGRGTGFGCGNGYSENGGRCRGNCAG